MQDLTAIKSLSDQLSAILESTAFLLPEICLTAFLILLILLDLIFKKKVPWLFTLVALLGFGFTVALLWRQWIFTGNNNEGISLFLDMLILDHLAVYFKLLVCLGGVITVLISFNYKSGSASTRFESLKRIGEYYSILLALVLGAMFLSMSTHMLMIYLSIELVSISSYILTNFNFDRKSAEAGIKYVLFGGVASGLMLYGMSLLYGLTGTLDLTSTNFHENISAAPSSLIIIGGLFTAGGFLFKISSVPFHIWAPDVYQGAPTPVTAIFSVVPKVAGFAVFMRYTSLFFSHVGSAFPWQTLLAAVAIATIIVGNFGALWQNNAKRMMAYSSVAHSGFILIGVLSASPIGMMSVLFYLGIYLLMNLAAFLMIKMIHQQTGAEEVRQYKGLGLQYPFMGVLMIIIMISLTGLPPTAGFTAKLFVFSALWDAYQGTGNEVLFVLLILGLLNTVVSLFYYLKIPYYMFFKKKSILKNAENQGVNGIGRQYIGGGFNFFDKVLALVLIFPLLILFFKADWLIEFIQSVPFRF